MYGRTAVTLDHLKAAHWFSKVGVRDTESAEVLPDWSSAIASCSSAEWQGLCVDAVNEYADRVRERSPADFDHWNDVVLDVRPSVLSLVREKTANVIAAHALADVFLKTVAWDILHVCIESEFADVYPPGFFASQAYWYVHGHFPCGWTGPFPEGGRLIVF
jgi:hypothetical protein